MSAPSKKESPKVVNIEDSKSRKMLRALRDHPFLCVVFDGDGNVSVYDKDIGPDEIALIREAIEGKLSERTDADGGF